VPGSLCCVIESSRSPVRSAVVAMHLVLDHTLVHEVRTVAWKI
jgi:hypothetical protein